MKKFIIIYNLGAGKGKGKIKAEAIKEELKMQGELSVTLFNSQNSEDLKNYFCEIKKLNDNIERVVIVVGGDGTLGTTVHSIVSNNLDFPIAVFPQGTANDFATAIKMSRNPKKFVDFILNNEPVKIDVANVNGYYAVNAIGGGNFSHGAEVYSARGKMRFGKLAYYFHCLSSAFKMKSQRLKVTIDDDVFEDDFLFYYVVNSTVAGGFKNFAPSALLKDGNYVFVGIKKCDIITFSFLFLKILIGRHGNSKKVLMRKGRHFKIEPIAPIDKKFVGSDLDGNTGPSHPLNIRVISKYIKTYARDKH